MKSLKKILLFISALAVTSTLYAQQQPNLPPSAFPTSLNTNAMEFAAQAGMIGGIVQACGQDITEYNARVLQAINILASQTSDREQAIASYEAAISKALNLQARSHMINCGQAIQSFRSLPLMQANYQQAVLPQLAQLNTTSPQTPTASPSPTPNNAAGNPSMMPTTPNVSSSTPTTPTSPGNIYEGDAGTSTNTMPSNNTGQFNSSTTLQQMQTGAINGK